MDQKVLESYADSSPLMLETWGRSIYQFYQPTLSSRYLRCSEIPQGQIISFGYPDCQLHSVIPLVSRGELDATSGALLIQETRTFGKQMLRNEGQYRCRKLGHTFSFTAFNYEQ